ncbi:MAG: hypothetical protein WA793_09325 [Sphingorhabdus sp.]|uniref:hypothetical protein n=1 Tax=Sphingorhabdus sp. TaxID=1902408 RepID=UPI003C9558E2
MTVVATPTTWREVRALADVRLGEELRHEFAKFEAQQVVRLSLPYGTPLIADGRFRWELLGANAGWEAKYGATIPLVLVTNRTVELSDVVTSMSRHTTTRNAARDPRPVPRSAPLYMTQAGEFFGLFENFAEDIGQGALNATAGGTTLMVLPPIADKKHLGRFLKGLGIERTKREREKIAPDLDKDTASRMAFGAFFAELLATTQCEWRCEVIVFAPEFVEKIRRNPRARAAIKEVALEQMALSHRRANVIIDVYRKSANGDGARLDHVQSLQFIAHNTRPGFTPVLGTAVDEEVLPAAALHGLIYPSDEEERPPLDSQMCYPHVFRPSLPDETSFYFLSRPYSGIYVREESNALDRVELVIEALEGNGAEALGSFWHATVTELYKHLDAQPDLTRAVKLPGGNSNLIKWGIIGFTPKVQDRC